MIKKKTLWLASILILTVMVSTLSYSTGVKAATAPTLGAAESYGVLAGSIVTNTGPTNVFGDVGVSPSIGVFPHVTGFPPGIAVLPGTIHDADAHAAAAQAANTDAFGFLDQPCTTTYAGVKDLVGLSLVPGVYCADAFELSGTLTLVGSGVWIFKSSSTLITSGTAKVVGGDPCSVWWRVVSSATLGTNTQLTGNILALTSITLATGAILDGRALAQTGAVTMDSNQITLPVCGTALLSLTKTVSPATYGSVGDVLTYTLVATNVGNVILTGVTINDPGLTVTSSTPAQGSSLAPGATMTVIGTRTITQANLCLPASLWAVEYRFGPPSPGYKFLPNNIFKSWTQVRWVNDGPGPAYNVTASITNQPVNVTVVDGQVNLGTIPAGGTAWSADTFTLLVNMNNPQNSQLGIVWQVEYDDCGGSLTNTATASGTSPTGVVSATASATATGVPKHHVITGIPKFKGEPAIWQ